MPHSYSVLLSVRSGCRQCRWSGALRAKADISLAQLEFGVSWGTLALGSSWCGCDYGNWFTPASPLSLRVRKAAERPGERARLGRTHRRPRRWDQAGGPIKRWSHLRTRNVYPARARDTAGEGARAPRDPGLASCRAFGTGRAIRNSQPARFCSSSRPAMKLTALFCSARSWTAAVLRRFPDSERQRACRHYPIAVITPAP